MEWSGIFSRGVVLVLLAPFARSQEQLAPEIAAAQAELGAAHEAERIPLLLQLARLQRDEPAAVVERTREALALLGSFPSPASEAEARIALSQALQAQGDYPGALEEARRAESLARKLSRDELLAAAFQQTGWVELRMADFKAAQAHAEQARELLAPHGNSDALVRTLTLLGAIRQSGDDPEGALERYLEALAMGQEMGDELAVARSQNNVGLVYWDLLRYEEALASLHEALAVHERLGPRSNLANTLNNVGLILIELERPAEAVPYLERALVLDEQAGHLYGQAKDLSNLGGAHEQLLDSAKALACHERALALREEIGDKEGIVRTRGALARMRLARGEAPLALPMVEAAIALAAEIDARRDHAELHETLAEVRAALGDDAGALEAYRRFHELETELAEGVSSARIAELELRHREAEHARDHAALAAEAAVRQQELRWLSVGSVLLAVGLVVVSVLLSLRARAQRALVESEQRYRTLFRTAVVPMLLIERESRRVIELNEPARKLCGDLPESAGVALAQLEPEWVRLALGRLLDSHAPDPQRLDDCRVDGDGRARWTELSASRVFLGGRECQLVSVRDTTEERVREEARLRADRLEALGVLAGGIAHDFNNALAAIVGYVTLAREVEDDRRAEMLALAERAALGARGLSQQLLTFAKGGKPVRSVVDVGRLLRESVGLAGTGTQLRIELCIADQLWHAHLDGDQFRQVVSNLVIHARQATSSGGHLVVRASNVRGKPEAPATAGDGRFVRLDFQDDGEGIPASLRARVFDPYFTTKAGGNGLGLAAAYAICRSHGGDLTLESHEGRGTTFSAFFPAANAAVPSARPVEARGFEGRGAILLLEDDPQVQKAVRWMLEHWGFEVEAVEEGSVAVRRHAERLESGRPFDLLLMDLTIPGGMGGREALARILERDPHALAIVASGYADDPTLAHYREAGFMAALAKPFRSDELARTLDKVLQGRVRPAPVEAGPG
ncbi:MAG: tetratricopeptide repeat protein [Planctomycetota bacterium]